MNTLRQRDLTRFRARLHAWFEANKRDLPWRQTADPYRIWVAEVMLQQTQVKTVIPFFNRFVARYPDLASLARADLEDVLMSWQNMGYYARARNLHKAAREVASNRHGIIPSDYEAFRSLPGVGDYIAAAVMSIAFGKPHAVVDGNVKRVLSRLFAIDDPVNRSSSARVFKETAAGLLDPADPGTFNQAVMELGATTCRPTRPLCGGCPVQTYCSAYRNGRQAVYPVRQPGRKIPEYHIAVGVIYKGDRMLITRRAEDGLLGGMWEFPGGKIETRESPEAACKREIKEEVGLDVDVTRLIAHVDHAYSHFKIGVDVFACRYRAGEVRLNGPVDHRWILIDETNDYPFPAVNHKIFSHLKDRDTAGSD